MPPCTSQKLDNIKVLITEKVYLVIDGMQIKDIKVSEIKKKLAKSVDNLGKEISAGLENCKHFADLLKF